MCVKLESYFNLKTPLIFNKKKKKNNNTNTLKVQFKLNKCFKMQH